MAKESTKPQPNNPSVVASLKISSKTYKSQYKIKIFSVINLSN